MRVSAYTLASILYIYICVQQSMGQGLVASYNFDNNLIDNSSYHNDGKGFGNVSFVADRFGNDCHAMLFNGSDTYVEVPNAVSLQSPSAAFTVACWFKLESRLCGGDFKWLTIVCKGDQPQETPNNPQYRLQTFQSSAQSTISINTAFTEYDANFSLHGLPSNQWSHYVLVYNGSFVCAYLNAIKIWEFPYTGAFNKNDAPLHIGKDIPGSPEFFCGALDDLKLYDMALSEPDIKKLYAETHTVIIEEITDIEEIDNIYTGVDVGSCSARVNYKTPALDLGCGKTNMQLIKGLPSGSDFPIGTTQIVYRSESSLGTTQTVRFKVVVVDNNKPEMTCLSDTAIYTDDTMGSRYVYSFPAVTANCTEASITLLQGLPSGSKFPVGKTKLAFKAINTSGIYTTCGYIVDVKLRNNIQPKSSDSIVCPGNRVLRNDSGLCGAMVSFIENKSANLKWKVLSGIDNGRLFPIGTVSNKILFTSGTITKECSFTITVNDQEKPKIQCRKDTSIYLSDTASGTIVYYANPKVTDNCKTPTLKLTEGIASGQFFPIGDTRNIFRATDSAGNYQECSFLVRVKAIKLKKTDSLPNTLFKPDEYAADKKRAKQYMLAAGLPDSVRFLYDETVFDTVISLVIYDDGFIDDDTVSIYFNDVAILNHYTLQRKHDRIPISVLHLKPNHGNYIIAKAWNMGKVPPNTLAIELYAGDITKPDLNKKPPKPFLIRKLDSRPGQASAILIRYNH